jgi:hypothetical protein
VKSPYRWKTLRIITRRRPSRDGVNGGLGERRTFRPVRTDQKKDVRPGCSSCEGRRGVKVKQELATGVSEARSHQRRGKKTPTLVTTTRSQDHVARGPRCMTVRRSGLGWREPSGPPILPCGAEDSVGCPRCESGVSESGTHEVQVHAVRLGGRHRLDASRVFSTGRSQGLLVKRGR